MVFLHAGRHRQVAPPSKEELQALLHRIAHRVARYLERQGLLERDVENSYLAKEACLLRIPIATFKFDPRRSLIGYKSLQQRSSKTRRKPSL